MAHPLADRVNGLLSQLTAARGSGAGASSASKGRERELFIKIILESVIAPPFRISSGEIVDAHGILSKQIDLAIENSLALGFPGLPGADIRLMLAEGVSCVLEIKSDLQSQWDQVVHISNSLRSLKLSYGTGISFGELRQTIPIIAVGFSGWSSLETIKTKAMDLHCGGIFQVDAGFFHSNIDNLAMTATGWTSLFAFLYSVQQLNKTTFFGDWNIVRYAQAAE